MSLDAAMLVRMAARARARPLHVGFTSGGLLSNSTNLPIQRPIRRGWDL